MLQTCIQLQSQKYFVVLQQIPNKQCDDIISLTSHRLRVVKNILLVVPLHEHLLKRLILDKLDHNTSVHVYTKMQSTRYCCCSPGSDIVLLAEGVQC